MAGKIRISDEQLHAMVSEAIQKTKGAIASKNASGYARNKTPIVGRRSLVALYDRVQNRVKNGRAFNGHGNWNAYLEAEHGVIPVGQAHWSDERLHWTISTLLKKHPVEKIAWSGNQEPRLRGMTLRTLYYRARSNNHLHLTRTGKLSRAEQYFGHGSWDKYVAWNRENYKV